MAKLNRCLTNMPYHKVLWFDVAVHDVVPVQVLEGRHQVVQHAASVPLCVLSGRCDGFK